MNWHPSELNHWWALQVHPKGASRVVSLGKLALQNVQDLKAGRWPEWVTVGLHPSFATARDGLKEVRQIVKNMDGGADGSLQFVTKQNEAPKLYVEGM